MRRQLEYEEMNHQSIRDGGIIVLDKLRTPENIGMIIRLAVAFGYRKVVIIEDEHSPGQSRISRISRSGIKNIETEYGNNISELLLNLKAENLKIIGIELTNDSIDIGHYTPNSEEEYVLIFGNERNGISREALDLCEMCLHIPVNKSMSSINVAMAAAIALHEFRKK